MNDEKGNQLELIGLAAGARLFGATGRGGVGVHPATLTRWGQRGALNPDGKRVKLRMVRIGSKWATSAVWVAEFIAATTAAHMPAEEVSPVRSPAARARDTAAADAALASMGV